MDLGVHLGRLDDNFRCRLRRCRDLDLGDLDLSLRRAALGVRVHDAEETSDGREEQWQGDVFHAREVNLAVLYGGAGLRTFTGKVDQPPATNDDMWRTPPANRPLAMPSEIEENLPPTNEGYGTREYW